MDVRVFEAMLRYIHKDSLSEMNDDEVAAMAQRTDLGGHAVQPRQRQHSITVMASWRLAWNSLRAVLLIWI
uniref:Uncharacterized protein n=1 Tax=Oryza glumipatula TaxID=40148 RepID=A0A0E0BLB6_9ORYZ